VQPLGIDLKPSGNMVLVPSGFEFPGIPGLTPAYYEEYAWLTLQGTAEEFWLAGVELESGLREVRVKGGQVQHRTVIDEGPKEYFECRVLTSREWEQERWVGFVQVSSPDFPYRILRLKDGCTYPLSHL
jgi:hypothetical protein